MAKKNINPALEKLLSVKHSIGFFNDLSNEEISEVIYNIRFKRYESGEIIFRENSSQNKVIYFLANGTVDLFLFSKKYNKDIYLTTLEKEQLFGEVQVLLGEPSSATAISGKHGAVLLTFLIKESREESAPLAFEKFYKNISAILARKLLKTDKILEEQ